MFKHILWSLIFCLSLISCNREPEKEVIEVPALRASSIYRHDSVYFYKEKFKDANKAIAESYYVKGLKLKETNPKKAIYNVKRSITLYPNAEAYRELGTLLSKNQMYREANQLYSFLVNKTYLPTTARPVEIYLFNQPDEVILHEYMMNSILEKNSLDPYIVYQAKQVLGKDITDLRGNLEKDERFRYDKSSLTYKNIMLQLMDDEEIEKYKASPAFFAEFLSSIKDSSNFFEIGKSQVQEFRYPTEEEIFDGEGNLNISDLFVHFLQEQQENPKSWYTYNFTHRMRLSDSVSAVIYAIDTSVAACPKDMRHIYHRLVTYGKNGKIIDSEIVAVQAGEILHTMKYNFGTFTVSEYQRTWAKPYYKNDFDNDVVRVEKSAEKDYRILPDGKIETTNAGENENGVSGQL